MDRLLLGTCGLLSGVECPGLLLDFEGGDGVSISIINGDSSCLRRQNGWEQNLPVFQGHTPLTT